MANPFEFLFCADVHLKEQLWRSDRSITGDTLYGFQQCLDYAVQLQVPLVIGGDLFDDKRPTSSIVTSCAQMVKRATDSGTTVYGIPGNHDDCTPPWTDLTNIISLTESGHNINGYNIRGINWVRDKEVLHQKLAALGENSCDFLVLHQLVAEITGETLSDIWIKDFPCNPARRGILIGDYHTPTVRTTERGFYGYPGSTCILNWGEASLPKNIWHIRQADMVLLPLKTRWIKRIRILSVADQEEFFDTFRTTILKDLREHREKVPEELKTGMLRLDVADDLTDFQDKFADIRRMAKVTESELRFNVTTLSRTMLLDSRKTLVQGSVDPLELLPLYLDPTNLAHQRVGTIARNLIMSASPQETINELTTELLAEVLNADSDTFK